jgi:hypothetical protein
LIVADRARYTFRYNPENPANWKFRAGAKKKIKAAPRFELGVEVLQTSALPLGYAAVTSEN